MEAQSRGLRPSFGQTTKDYYVFGHFSCQLIPSIFATRWHLEMRASFHRRWATLRASPTGVNQPTMEIRRRSPLSNFPGKVGAIVVALGGGWKCAYYALPIAFHNFGLEYRFDAGISSPSYELANLKDGPNSQTPRLFPYEIKIFRVAEKGQKLVDLGRT